jgi:hypothetical protein
VGQVWVVEWLSSLIDGNTSGAVSGLSGAKPHAELRFWVEGLTPESVTDMTTTPDGYLAFAAVNHGITVVDATGAVIDRFLLDHAPRRIAFGEDGELYIADAAGAVTALTRRGLPERFGGRALALGVPVLGTLTEAVPEQSWTYAGAAGEHVTISAVDQSRASAYEVGLDMALSLLAPDGSVLAGNDDQLGTDLFGVYDAQIADFVLPYTGTFTVRAEWKQGQGMYTLGISSSQPVELSANGVTRLSGSLQDVFPVQRWTFAGYAGDVLTLTMSAESHTTNQTGKLDPALALRQPDGTLLAFNDDAADLQLDVDAQLTQVRLPEDGVYLIEASRFEGAGSYSLVIVNTTNP